MVRSHAAVALLVVTLALAGCAAPPPSGPSPPGPPSPPPPPPPSPPGEAPFEVWLIDQADSAADGGGTLHIYRGEDLAANPSAARAETLDLGGAARDACVNQTGSAPRRPHMLMFHEDAYAVLAYVATGHVLFLNATSRAPVGCVDVGAQAHAAFPARDGSFVLVANQNGKLLQRVRTDWAARNFTLEDAATLNLTACTTPTGARCEDPSLRPDNAPICPVLEASGRWAFVTLRGGGMFIVDARATPMAIVAEYDNATIHPNGCGGVEVAGKMFITSGGGTATNPLEADLYEIVLAQLPLASPVANVPLARRVLTMDDQAAEFHGALLAKDPRWLWLADRHGNRIVVVDTTTGQAAGEIPLAGNLSADPAPDLLALDPSGSWAFASLRGPNPLTGNAPAVNNSVGATPGLAVLRVDDSGRSGALVGVVRVGRMLNGTEAADPHAIAVRAR